MKAALFMLVALVHGALAVLLVAPGDCGGMGSLAALFTLALWLAAYLMAVALGALSARWLCRAVALTLGAAVIYGASWPQREADALCTVAPPAPLLFALAGAGVLAWALPALRRRFG
ncbi:hypothetical protein [Crenobacter caeni]|uniref:Uncharacterized protein n=1 Tax=Crenobacter caeni TaxID=2705474 RepID=A0A6B2KTY4_9NEIS|nr:hypothetical protein [Crenobacter caeni]NDV13706.1 hypothetical protein [Crenobacter caeni]